MGTTRRFGRFAVAAAIFGGILTAGAAQFAAPAMAGDYYCKGSCDSESWPRPIKRTIISRIEIEPGLYEIEREPSLYGWVERRVLLSTEYGYKPEYRTVKKRILLKPYKNKAVYHRGKYKFIREQVVIYPETEEFSYFSGKD